MLSLERDMAEEEGFSARAEDSCPRLLEDDDENEERRSIVLISCERDDALEEKRGFRLKTLDDREEAALATGSDKDDEEDEDEDEELVAFDMFHEAKELFDSASSEEDVRAELRAPVSKSSLLELLEDGTKFVRLSSGRLGDAEEELFVMPSSLAIPCSCAP